jgi:hypothetical protein
MKKTLALLAFLFSAIPAFAQAPTPTQTFNFTAQAVALPGGKTTVPAMILGGTFAITPRFSLRNDNLMVPGSGFSGYFGGFEYSLPQLGVALNNMSPNLNGNKFQFYLTGSMGIDRIALQDGSATQHYAFLAGGGVRYDPTSSGHFSVNLIEVRWAKLPGYANSTAVVSSGLTLSF